MRVGARIRRWWQRITAPPSPKAAKPVGRWHERRAAVIFGASLEPEHKQAMICAIGWWNERFPNTFTFEQGGRHADEGYPPVPGIISVTTAPPLGKPNVRASTELHFKELGVKRIGGAHIRLRPDISGVLAERTCAHELGHCLGLGHTQNPQGHLMGIGSGDGWRLLPEEVAFVRSLPLSRTKPR